jgi:DNA-binding PadR family transcriptional regulator
MRNRHDHDFAMHMHGVDQRGRGPFGRGFPDNERRRGGPHQWGRGDGRRARRGDIRLAVLQLIANEPANGYGLITKIAERTDDRWRPSPGSIYPVLQLLVEEGYATQDEGDAGLYTISDAGREYLANHAEQARQVWENGRGASESEEQVRESLQKLMGAAREVSANGSDEQRARAAGLLDDVRRLLYAILSE